MAEYYISRRLALRFDVGDSMVRFSDRKMFEVDLSPLPEPVPGKTTHNLQINVGIVYRF